MRRATDITTDKGVGSSPTAKAKTVSHGFVATFAEESSALGGEQQLFQPVSFERSGAAPIPQKETPFRLFLWNFSRSRLAVFALAVLVLAILMAIFAPLLTPQNPYDLGQLDILDSTQPPGTRSGAGYVFWLGSDDQGRDIYSAILYGLRISLSVGGGSALIACLVGGCLGLLAAYIGGRVDTVIMRVVDLQLAFPAILVALMILAFLGKGVVNVLLALIIVEWAYYARVLRGTALAERRREYIEAAECLVLPRWRIIFRHLLPNCLPPIIVVATQQVARAIALEATLSFLGLGVPITEPSLGLLIANGYQYMLSGKYWLTFFPGIALLVVIVALNLVGDQLRDVLSLRPSK
jgi:peptide/nickel transport system permease protein